jgi:hypothetical protein
LEENLGSGHSVATTALHRRRAKYSGLIYGPGIFLALVNAQAIRVLASHGKRHLMESS